jgi:hypothetical protein
MGTMAYKDDQLMRSFQKWFREYVETFCADQSEIRGNILLKKDHSKRVYGEIIRIGRSLGLSGDSFRFAEITALFHDVGRFEQYFRHRTFLVVLLRVGGYIVNKPLGKIVESHENISCGGVTSWMAAARLCRATLSVHAGKQAVNRCPYLRTLPAF